MAVIQQIYKSPCCLLGPFKGHPMCANRSENCYKCPLYSSLHVFLMTHTKGHISQPQGVKAAPSWSLCAWEGQRHWISSPFPPTHRSLEAEAAPESSVMAWNEGVRGNLRGKGQGPSDGAQPPAPSFGLCASVPHQLCAARRQSGSCKAGSLSRWCREKERRDGNAPSLRGRQTGPQANPCENCLLWETGQKSRSQGPGCCPMREIIPPPTLPARWETAGNQEGHCPWEHRHPPPQ